MASGQRRGGAYGVVGRDSQAPPHEPAGLAILAVPCSLFPVPCSLQFPPPFVNSGQRRKRPRASRVTLLSAKESPLTTETTGRPSSSQLARFGVLVVAAAVAFWFWDTLWVWPLKILVVMFHELGHALMAWATGGRVVEIGLSPQQGGHTLTQGGIRLLILNAGYLGSLCWGVVLLALARRTRTARLAAAALAGLLAVVTLVFVPWLQFGWFFSIAAAACLGLLARFAPGEMTAFALRGLGVFSVLYALWDIVVDVFGAPSDAVTDASMLAELTWIPAPVWGVGWLIAGVVILVLLRRWII